MRLALPAALLGALACTPALAQTIPNPSQRFEIRGGLVAHDPSFLMGKEGGLGINFETLFPTLAPRSWSEGMPSYYAWVFTPRIHLGGTIHTEGRTSRGYFGLTWTTMLARDVFRPGDGIRFDYAFGGSVNDGERNTFSPDRKALGSNILFRLGAEVGYQLDRNWSVSVFLDHDSNAGLARRNQAINTIGARVGYAF